MARAALAIRLSGQEMVLPCKPCSLCKMLPIFAFLGVSDDIEVLFPPFVDAFSLASEGMPFSVSVDHSGTHSKESSYPTLAP